MIHLRGAIGYLRISLVSGMVKVIGCHQRQHHEQVMLDLSPAEAWELAEALQRQAIEAGHEPGYNILPRTNPVAGLFPPNG